MSFETRSKEEAARLKKMGYALILFALSCSLTVFLLPNSESVYWFSEDGKLGFYVLSAFLAFLGFYCLGAIWRRRHFY